VKRFFSEIIPPRRSKKSLIGTIVLLVAILFLIDYLTNIAKGP